MMSRPFASRSSDRLPTRWDRSMSTSPMFTCSLRAARSFTSPSVSSFALSAMPRIRTVFRRQYCSKSSPRSSTTVSLACNAKIWSSFLAISSLKVVVRVDASPRRRAARASVVTGPVFTYYGLTQLGLDRPKQDGLSTSKQRF